MYDLPFPGGLAPGCGEENVGAVRPRYRDRSSVPKMKCPSCGHFYDDKASDREGPECAGCAEEMMASDEIGKGGGDRRYVTFEGLGTPPAWQRSDGVWYRDERTGPKDRRVATYRDWIGAPIQSCESPCEACNESAAKQLALILALRRAPDPVEAEYREAAQAHGEADIEFELCSCDAAVDCPHWNAMVLTRARLIAARAARDGAR